MVFLDLLIKAPCSNGSEFGVDGVEREFDLISCLFLLFIEYFINTLYVRLVLVSNIIFVVKLIISLR